MTTVIDCEASGLSDRSFPIQVGWERVETGEHGVFHIIPAAAWLAEGLWEESAEEIHGITVEYLFEKGVSAEEGANILSNFLHDGEDVLSDAPFYDNFWLLRLYQEANIPMPFTCTSILNVNIPENKEDEFQSALENLNPPHDALGDAMLLAGVLRQVIL